MSPVDLEAPHVQTRPYSGATFLPGFWHPGTCLFTKSADHSASHPTLSKAPSPSMAFKRFANFRLRGDIFSPAHGPGQESELSGAREKPMRGWKRGLQDMTLEYFWDVTPTKVRWTWNHINLPKAELNEITSRLSTPEPQRLIQKRFMKILCVKSTAAPYWPGTTWFNQNIAWLAMNHSECI